jgi:hypothetical protein
VVVVRRSEYLSAAARCIYQPGGRTSNSSWCPRVNSNQCRRLGPAWPQNMQMPVIRLRVRRWVWLQLRFIHHHPCYPALQSQYSVRPRVHEVVENCLYACKEGFEIEVPVGYGPMVRPLHQCNEQMDSTPRWKLKIFFFHDYLLTIQCILVRKFLITQRYHGVGEKAL